MGRGDTARLFVSCIGHLQTRCSRMESFDTGTEDYSRGIERSTDLTGKLMARNTERTGKAGKISYSYSLPTGNTSIETT